MLAMHMAVSVQNVFMDEFTTSYQMVETSLSKNLVKTYFQKHLLLQHLQEANTYSISGMLTICADCFN